MRNVKISVLVGIIAIFCIVAGGLLALRNAARKPRVVLYGIPKREAEALRTVIGDQAACTDFAADTSLYYQLRHAHKPDMLITVAGEKLNAALAEKPASATYDSALLTGVTSAIRTGVHEEGQRVSSLPLLSSHFEIDIHTEILHDTGITAIATWDDIERFATAARARRRAYIAFAGKDAATTLDLLGALTEALDGRHSYDAAAAILRTARKGEQAFNAQETARLLAIEGDAPLFSAVRLLRGWFDKGLLHPETFSFDKTTLGTFMTADLISMTFMSLNDHRAYDVSVIKPYASICVPSQRPPSVRAFTAPVLYAVPFTKQKKALALAQQLMTADTQENLSHMTGLAPVLAQCPTPDQQADDARYWVAATNAPLAGLSREAALSDAQWQELSAALARIIRFGT
ncbi:MAG: hypothetical protein K2J81_02570 [Treponemataceae bacterium]|nr:hypothetical protein [Treponemataceae bacterium]